MNKHMVLAIVGMGFVVACGSSDGGGYPAAVVETTGSAGSSVVSTTVGTAGVGQAGSSVGNSTTGVGGSTGGSDLTTTTSTTGDTTVATTTTTTSGAGGSTTGDTTTVGTGGTNQVDSGSAGSGGSDVGNDAGNDVNVVADAGTDAGNDAPPPNQCTRSCTLTSGYWLNHSDWCVVPVVMSGVSYSQAEATALIALPSVNDGSIVLAQQLVAAIENGIAADTSSSSAAMYSAAEDWMTSNKDVDGRLPYGVSTISDAGIVAVAIGASLDNYNQGKSGVKPHCPE